MTGLAANTEYDYSVGSDAGRVAFSFTNEPAARPPIFAVYADFGYKNDESLKALIADAEAGGFDAVIHAGGLSRTYFQCRATCLFTYCTL